MAAPRATPRTDLAWFRRVDLITLVGKELSYVSSARLVLSNARLADGSTDFGRHRRTVVVDDGVIVSTDVDRGEVPEGALDLAGATVVPGLIDAHMHVMSSDITRNPGFGPPPELKGGEPRARELGYFVLAAMAKAVLEAGITTVRDVGCDDCEAIVLRQAVNLGVVPGPQVLSCGRIISATSPGGVLFHAMYRQARSGLLEVLGMASAQDQSHPDALVRCTGAGA